MNRLGGEFASLTELDDIAPIEYILDLPINETIQNDGLLLRRAPDPRSSDRFLLFVGKDRYPLEALLADIWRFLILDILIILPFYFLGRSFVRRALAPVRENMLSMESFIQDAGHELKTPIAIISSNLQYLRDTPERDPEVLEQTLAAVIRLTDLIDGLIELDLLRGAPTDSVEIGECVA